MTGAIFAIVILCGPMVVILIWSLPPVKNLIQKVWPNFGRDPDQSD